MTQKKQNRSADVLWMPRGAGILSVITIAALLVAFLFLVLFTGPLVFDKDYRIAETSKRAYLDTGWILDTDDGSVKLPVLPTKVAAKSGEVVCIHNVIPHELASENLAIAFPTAYQTAYVYVDDVLVYQWDTKDDRWIGSASPGTWNFVVLGAAAAGKAVAVELSTPYWNVSGQIYRVMIGDETDLKLSVVLMYLPRYVLCIALIICGLLLYVNTFILSRMSATVRPLRYVGLFIVLTALYLRTQTKMPQLSFISDYGFMQIGFLMFALAPLPYVLYVRSRVRDEADRRICDVLFYVFLAFFVTELILQAFGVIDFYELLPILYFLVVLLIIYVVFLYARGIRRLTVRVDYIEITGLLTLFGGLLFEIYYYLNGGYAQTGTPLLIGTLVYSLSVVISLTRDIISSSRERERLAAELRDSRLQLMIGQIRPHFIYNTLNAVYGQIAVAPDVASELIYNFSRFLRANVDSASSNEMITFSKELDIIRTYSRIEEIRFDGRVKVVFDIDPDAFSVPPLSIQPFVENAIKHGVCKRDKGGTVWVSSYDEQKYFVITVVDDGVGFAAEDALNDMASGAGLRNVRLRLEVMLQAQVTIQSEVGIGTIVVVSIPKERQPSVPFQLAERRHNQRGRRETDASRTLYGRREKDLNRSSQ